MKGCFAKPPALLPKSSASSATHTLFVDELFLYKIMIEWHYFCAKMPVSAKNFTVFARRFLVVVGCLVTDFLKVDTLAFKSGQVKGQDLLSFRL